MMATQEAGSTPRVPLRKEATKVFVIVPNYWAYCSSFQKALECIRGESSRRISELKRKAHIAIEFPSDVTIEVHPVDGSWTASGKAIRIVSYNKLKPGALEDLQKLVRRPT